MRLLLIEDDEALASALTDALTMLGHAATNARTAAEGIRLARDVDVVLLDLGLPDRDGIEVLAQLRRVTAMPILILTAREDERSIVRGLRLGADDYLVKPVRVPELLARVEAVRRRLPQATSVSGDLVFGPIAVDRGARAARIDGEALPLTNTEFALLELLVERAGAVATREELLDAVWGDAFLARSRALDVHLTALRAKLGRPLIRNVRGVGYRLAAEGE